MQNDDDDAEVTQKRASNRKSFQESLPHSRETGTTRAEVKGLKASQPGEKIPVGHPDATKTKRFLQTLEAMEPRIIPSSLNI